MESQTQKLKLNVTNIKSFLINSNEKIRKLEYRKSSIIRNENKKIERKNLEEKLLKKRENYMLMMKSLILRLVTQ